MIFIGNIMTSVKTKEYSSCSENTKQFIHNNFVFRFSYQWFFKLLYLRNIIDPRFCASQLLSTPADSFEDFAKTKQNKKKKKQLWRYK